MVRCLYVLDRFPPVSRGLSSRQARLLAILVVARRPLDVTGELGPMLGEPESKSGRASLLRAVRLLESRGLVALQHRPAPRGGWPRLLASARPGAEGELLARDLQQARALAGR